MSSYKAIAVSQTGASLAGAGQVGKRGDILKRLIISVATSATGTVTLIDGSTSIVITAANTPIGVYHVEIDAPAESLPGALRTRALSAGRPAGVRAASSRRGEGRRLGFIRRCLPGSHPGASGLRPRTPSAIRETPLCRSHSQSY